MGRLDSVTVRGLRAARGMFARSAAARLSWVWGGKFGQVHTVTQKNGCCYPTTGKPAANFGIHGLWPNFNNGSYPSDCDPNNHYNEAEISDLISCMQKEWPSLSCPSCNGSTFWAHEWNKHGTCSESVLDQHAYFESALNLKADIVLLQILENAGIS
ncbi:hypothetical protein TIFTF001_050434 [Ficus carica]|uniref:Uncharacterized protein n=1 Tax=Ficus carica TaxID=3494 RepID=A0AA87Z8Q5_FICCA|nr:hypothetical protein TIFTF001_050434 [Ficus carica]